MLARLFVRRVPRRIVSHSIVLLAAIVLVLGGPALLLTAIVTDLVQDWKRHRWLRLLAIVTLYVFNELFGLVSMFILWVLSGFGLAIRSPLSFKAHGILHGRWTSNLLWGVDKILRGRIEIRNRDAVDPSPVVIMSRHISFLDAVVPSVLLAGGGRRAVPRHVLMQELRWEPCIDTLGHRTPNHFVDRTAGGKVELEAIRRVGRSVEAGGSAIIFPEGGFRTPARFDRAIARLEERQPELAEQASGFAHVLPPRPNGSRALLAGAEDVDVVMVAHCGFENFTSLKKIVANIPVPEPVIVELKRIPRAEIPMDPAGFHAWLLDQYQWIDDFAERRGAPEPDATPTASDVELETHRPGDAVDIRSVSSSV